MQDALSSPAPPASAVPATRSLPSPGPPSAPESKPRLQGPMPILIFTETQKAAFQTALVLLSASAHHSSHAMPSGLPRAWMCAKPEDPEANTRLPSPTKTTRTPGSRCAGGKTQLHTLLTEGRGCFYSPPVLREGAPPRITHASAKATLLGSPGADCLQTPKNLEAKLNTLAGKIHTPINIPTVGSSMWNWPQPPP